MFEEVLDLPAHPLLVHVPVVFVPLLIIAAVAYALVPFVRRWIAWAVVGLAVVTPLAAWFATLSGNAFRERLARQGMRPEGLAEIDVHSEFGEKALWFTLGLAVVAVLLVVLLTLRDRRPSVVGDRGNLLLTAVLTVGIIVLAGISGYYVFKAGDSGARIVWAAAE